MNGLVSVVIIFLDAERFLQEAIDSLRQQTYANWELLLVDDGSSDGGTALARHAAQADPRRVRYVQHPDHLNRGTSQSRNLGLREAQGEFVLYLDADDILMPNALARLVDILDRHAEAGAAAGATLFWFWAREFAAKRDHVQSFAAWTERLIRPPRFLSAVLRVGMFQPANCSTLLRTALLRRVGGFDTAFRGMFEDSAMLAKILLVSPIYVVGDVLSAYRMHPGSQCHTAAANGSYHFSQPNRDRETYLRWLQRHVRRSGVRDVRLHLTLRRELWVYDRPAIHRLAESRMVRLLLWMALWLAGRRRPPAQKAAAVTDDLAGSTVSALQALESFYTTHRRPDEAALLRQRWQSRPAQQSAPLRSFAERG